MTDLSKVTASLHMALAGRGLVAGFRPGDRVSVTFGGVTATGEIATYEYLRPVGSQVVFLDGTRTHVRVTESLLERI